MYGIESGRFHEAKHLIDNYTDDSCSHVKFVEEVISFMDSKGVGDTDLQELLEVTFGVAQQQGIFTFRVDVTLSHDEDEPCLEYWIEVPEEVETVVELNMQLANAIIEQCPASIAKQSGFVPIFITAREE